MDYQSNDTYNDKPNLDAMAATLSEPFAKCSPENVQKALAR